MKEQYMKRCIELARKAEGHTYPNPLVGCVIVHNDQIIGEGFHKKAGENHAEINAIQSVEDPSLLPESTLYVSLEPCAHFGKTPPCAEKLVEKKFKKVVIGSSDSHEKVNGKGKKILLDAGITVEDGILEKECRALNKRFFTYHEKKRPFILLKWAETQDGFLDQNFLPTAISNPIVNQYTHHLRSREHAILVGTQTALSDNPSLTVRNIVGRNPIRILIDFSLKVPQNFNIYNDKAETIVFNGIKNESQNGVTFIKIEKENTLPQMMKALYDRQIQSVLVEGGSATLQHFINSNIWDEALVIKNTDFFAKNGTLAPQINKIPYLEEQIDDNILYFYENKR